jgi:hypothetical protein
VNGVLDTTVKVYANVLTQVVTEAHMETKLNSTFNSACTSARAFGTADAVALSMGKALASAVAINFDKKCGYALSGFDAKAMAENVAGVSVPWQLLASSVCPVASAVAAGQARAALPPIRAHPPPPPKHVPPRHLTCCPQVFSNATSKTCSNPSAYIHVKIVNGTTTTFPVVSQRPPPPPAPCPPSSPCALRAGMAALRPTLQCNPACCDPDAGGHH